MSLLMAVDALRASFVGLFGSRDQKFKVTTKGMSRNRVVIHWGLLHRFLLLGGLTLGGMLLSLWSGPAVNTPPEVETMNLFWSFYNIGTLVLAGLICIELPRFRGEERFIASEPVTLLVGNASLPATLQDLSLSGARLSANPGALTRVDALRLVILDVGSVSVSIVSRVAETVQVQFHLTSVQHIALVRKIFSGRYVNPVTSMSSWRMLRLVIGRLVG